MKQKKYGDKFLDYTTPQEKDFRYYAKKILFPFYSLFYKLCMIFHHKKCKVEKKYKVAICGIFKNEARYLKEWLDFHLVVGVSHFYLYNNNSEDDYLSILQPYITSGVVELIDWPKEHSQMDAYRDCIKRYSTEAQWIGFIDIDEFVVPNEFDNIYDFLKKYNNKRPAVMIYWKIFGTSGKIDRDYNNLVIEDFTICWHKYINIGKCFYNTNYEFDAKTKQNYSLHHCLWTKIAGISVPPVNLFDKISFNTRHKVKAKAFPIQINHYFTKSYNEYVHKSSRGDVYYKISPYDKDYFYKYETKCTDVDYKIFKYIIKVKTEDSNNLE